MGQLVARSRSERMPSTSRVYGSFLDNHILPRWGDTLVCDVQPRPVELWLRQLPLSPKSKAHVRSLMRGLLDFAMWVGIIEIARNPISLVVNKGTIKRTRKARSLVSRKRWHCGGQILIGSRLCIKRGIVEQIVDDVKTEGSARTIVLANDLLTCRRLWKQQTQFSSPDDWVFASSVKIGRLPYSYTGVWRELDRAAKNAGIGHLGTHSFRYTYRSWLDAVGTSLSVQQKMMRHSDIRTTMNIYGDVVTDEMTTASSKVAELAFRTNGAQAERNGS